MPFARPADLKACRLYRLVVLPAAAVASVLLYAIGQPLASAGDRAYFQQSDDRGADDHQRERDETELDRLVQRLADDHYELRLRAAQALLKSGESALPALARQHDAAVLELRLASRRLSAQIRAELEQRRVEEFLAGHGPLPCWNLFARYAGDTAESRRNFYSLYRERESVIRRIDDSANDPVPLLDEWLNDRDESGIPQYTSAHAEDWAVFALVVAMNFAPDAAVDQLPPALCSRLGLAMLGPLSGRGHEDPRFVALIRGAATSWIAAHPHDLPNAGYRVMVAERLDIAEGLAPAIYCLEQRDRSFENGRRAFDVVARQGNEEHLPLLETLIDDSRIVRSKAYFGDDGDGADDPLVYRIQVGDYALAALIALAGEDFTAYGFAEPETDSRGRIELPESQFLREEQRIAAQRKWAEYRRTHPNPGSER